MTDTWSDPRVWVALEKLTATKMNEISTLLRVIYPYDAAGQLAYTDTSTTLAALDKPTTRARLSNNASGNFLWLEDAAHYASAMNGDIALTTSNAVYFSIPDEYDGFDVVSFTGFKTGGTGTVTLKLRNVTQSKDVLSANLTINVNNTVRDTATINTSNDNVAAGDIMQVSVVGAGTNSFNVNFMTGLRKA